ncbi:MAG: asparaginase [Marmoricola sp.]|jgi:L-asparaginase|nr:asparaginase [Marmoricola sp.]
MTPRVTLICLGGTIASTSSGDRGGVAPNLRGENLLAGLDQEALVAQMDVIDVATVPSWDLNFEHVASVIDEIAKAVARGSTGVVITQGTDTLEEVAFAVDLLVDTRVPVAFVAAMRHSGSPGSDGPANLRDAIATVLDPRARGLGCIVVMNGEVHHAADVRKTHTSSVGAFSSPDVGPCGWIHEGALHLRARSSHGLKLHVEEPASIRTPPLVRLGIQDDGWWLDPVRSLNSGLVIEGLGGGHVPSSIAPAVEELAREIPVVMTSRAGRGSVLTSTYDAPGSEIPLRRAGVISAGVLDGIKARVLLGVLLAQKASRADIEYAFARCGSR